MSVNDFIDRLSCSEGGPVREWVRATADLTVKLTVGYTSQDRPDGYPFFGVRGTSIPRVGTGYIYRVDSEINEPCPCDNCDGQEVRKYWRFLVLTAQHVVYDTEEAKRTRLDLFYDDETSRQDGKVVSVWALRVDESNTESDLCMMECVTHDERIGEMVDSLYRRWRSLTISRPIYSKKSSLLDRLRKAEATRSRSRPIYSKKSSLLDRLRKAEATRSRSRPIYSKKSSLLDRLRKAEATRSKSRPIYSKKSSLLDRLRKAEATRSRSRPIYFKKSSLLDRLRKAEATRSRSRPIYFKKSSLSGEGQVYTLIISHPHGQAKKITLGKRRPTVKGGNFRYQEYETATCPGSSGASVFELYTKDDDVFLRQDVFDYHGFIHNGTVCYIHGGTQSSSVSTDQINYGHFGYWFY